jgi:hypothetical protein
LSALVALPRQVRACLLAAAIVVAVGACGPPALTGAPSVGTVTSAATPTVAAGSGFTLSGPRPRSSYTVHFVVGTTSAIRTEAGFVVGRLTTLAGIRFTVGVDIPAKQYADAGEIVLGSGLSCHVANEGGCTTIFANTAEINGAVVTVASTTPSADLRPTLLHELGHAVGLAHWSGAPAQIMNPGLQSFTDYQAGDRNGLAALRGMLVTR